MAILPYDCLETQPLERKPPGSYRFGLFALFLESYHEVVGFGLFVFLLPFWPHTIATSTRQTTNNNAPQPVDSPDLGSLIGGADSLATERHDQTSLSVNR